MLSRHATMGLLLLRATAALAWTPSALRLYRLVAARPGRYVASQRCPSRTFPAGSSITRSSNSRHGARTFGTSKMTATPVGAAVGDGGAEKKGSSTERRGVGEHQDAAAATPAVVADASTIGGIEVQPLLQPHMELLGSAGRRK